MKAVLKFDLEFKDCGTTVFRKIRMPIGAKILCAGVQGKGIFLWAECVTESPTREKELRSFAIYGTGDEMQAVNRRYIGTVFLDDNGPLVEHVFELV